ncbi:FAD-dependent oxidoreductase [Amycolatopsis balhimycina DSM 5908]|uniref:FAD-dependent oxidoreductase n=1 Tax=Amycolatopsis balhimycina DSM 5908 TaxID=1081091 RepID=A0A428X2W9_AMYBA|nr:FAD-dependent oxidoreductase [Amycolatopsis balhimycina]RSM49652.1 FAD-dependent oxidoreductase [Amycolatopsis balhimycina DSM 5908]
MAARPRVVVLGAGLTGCALADELTERGWTDVTVLGAAGQDDTPGLVFRTHADRTLTEFAKYTVEKYGGLGGEWCFNPVGSLEIATTPERLEDLKQHHGWATSWGVRGYLRTPSECADLHPLLDATRVLGGFHVPGDGLLHARRAAEAQARRAQARGARFAAGEVVAVDRSGGRVTGVVTTAGLFRADVVVSCGDAGKLVGLRVPHEPLPHEYALTSPLPELAGHNDEHVQAGKPVLRHLDTGMYVREHVDRLGVGVTRAAGLVPALRDAEVETTTTVVLPGTPDGRPLLGEHPDLDGFWVAEAVRVEHSAGVARELARWLVDGQPSLALHGCDLARFGPAGFTAEPVRASPFYERQAALGASFGATDGWARPEWYQAGEEPPVVAEALVTRSRVAMFDLTPVPRLSVTGPGALPFLQAMTTNDLAKAPGTVTNTLLLGEDGGVRGELVVARLGDERFHVGAGGRLDFDWLRRHRPGDGTVQIHDTTPGTCCLGLWGPLAGDVLPELSTTDFSVEETYVGDVPVVALRLSTVGEPGWELHTTADLGRRLWDTLREHGVAVAGHQAFAGLRLEAGARTPGVDFTTEHDPYEAGLGFAVRMDKGYFIGRDALAGRSEATVSRRLTRLTTDAVVLGKEPVYAEGRPAGYVTSAGRGHTVGENIAYAWLPVEYGGPGTPVEVEHFGTRVPGTVT